MFADEIFNAFVFLLKFSIDLFIFVFIIRTQYDDLKKEKINK